MAGKRKSRSGSDRHRSTQPRHGDVPAPLRLAVGLGDAERERLLLSALSAGGDFVVAERCLSADQLLTVVSREQIDAVLVAFDLHRLTEARRNDLTRTRIPLVLLGPDRDHNAEHSFPGTILPVDADPDMVRRTLMSVVRGERAPLTAPRDTVATQPAETAPAGEKQETPLSVITVASGAGSPGRTTVALNLAAALGAVAPIILIDADMNGPSVAACIDADPTRNFSMLFHAEPETRGEWDRAIADEVQPLNVRSPHASVLCGIPKPVMRGGTRVQFFERLIAELRQRYRYVILDIGADVVGADAALHRSSLALADQILLVTSADLLGLWRTRTALGLIESQGIEPERIAVIINRRDQRYHHARAEIEWALGLATATVIPYDHSSAHRALAAQRPLILDGRSRAGHALLDLAERIHGGSIALPPETMQTGRTGWVRRLPRLTRTGRRLRRERKGVLDGDYVTTIS